MKQNFIVKGKTYIAEINKGEKFYIAESPELGTYSQGKTIKESVKNLKEATELYLEVFPMKELTKIKEPMVWRLKHVKTSKNIRF